MLFIIALTAFIGIWRIGLRTSTKFSRTTWELLAHLQFAIFIVCLMGFSMAQQPNGAPLPADHINQSGAPALNLKAPRDQRTNPEDWLGLHTPNDLSGFVWRAWSAPAPRISSISPQAFPASKNNQAVSVFGSSFKAGALVVLAHERGHLGYSAYGHFSIVDQGSLPWSASHLHFEKVQSDPFRFRDVFRPQSPVVVQVSTGSGNTNHGLLYWITLIGLIVMPLGIISTNILAWMTYRRQTAEAILKQAQEARLRQKEMRKLKRELRKLRIQLQAQRRR